MLENGTGRDDLLVHILQHQVLEMLECLDKVVIPTTSIFRQKRSMMVKDDIHPNPELSRFCYRSLTFMNTATLVV